MGTSGLSQEIARSRSSLKTNVNSSAIETVWKTVTNSWNPSGLFPRILRLLFIFANDGILIEGDVTKKLAAACVAAADYELNVNQPLTLNKGLSQVNRTIGRYICPNGHCVEVFVQNVCTMLGRQHPAFDCERSRVVVTEIIGNVFANQGKAQNSGCLSSILQSLTFGRYVRKEIVAPHVFRVSPSHAAEVRVPNEWE